MHTQRLLFVVLPSLDDGVVEAARLRRGGDVVVDELAPLHHHHRELLRVGVGSRVDGVAHRARARQLLVALSRCYGCPELARLHRPNSVADARYSSISAPQE